MNIFITNSEPKQAAKFLDDKRVIKMVLESAQMLSTAVLYHKKPEYFVDNSKENKQSRISLANSLGIYKPTHINHPSNVWARETRANWNWLFEHFEGLCEEYTLRYNKIHKSSQISSVLLSHTNVLPPGELTPFANCAAHKDLGLDFKNVKPTTEAYKQYLNKRWETDVRAPTWYKKREKRS